MMRWRRTLARAAAAIALAVGASAVAAQGYPAKPLRIILGFAAGGTGDITARTVAQKLSAQLGQQVIVENRPSAGGIVAAEAVAKAEPDGYTLLLLTNGNAVSASMFKTLPYDTANDFAPISTVGFFDVLVVVNADSTIRSIRDLIAYAKANPGKLNIGTVNIGSTQHLAAELFKSMAAIDVTTVPFKTSGALLTALRGADVQIGFEMIAPVMPQLRAGAVRALGITADRRFPGLPDVPTVAEAGIAEFRASAWNALAAPARTPRAVIDRLNKEVRTAIAAPEVRDRLQELGVVARASTPEELKELLVRDIAKWQQVIERAKIERQ